MSRDVEPAEAEALMATGRWRAEPPKLEIECERVDGRLVQRRMVAEWPSLVAEAEGLSDSLA